AWRELLHRRHNAGKGFLAAADVVAHVEVYLEGLERFIPRSSPERSQQDVERHAGGRGHCSKRQLGAAAVVDPQLLHDLKAPRMEAYDITDDLIGLNHGLSHGASSCSKRTGPGSRHI